MVLLASSSFSGGARFSSSLQQQDSVVFIMGMHHSMTSVAAKLLLDTQLFYGGERHELILQPNNPLKYWEFKRCVQANQALFKSQGDAKGRRGATSVWSGYGVTLTDGDSNDKLRQQAHSVLSDLKQRHKKKKPLLLKDPRLSLTIPLWLEQAHELNLAPQCVVLVRDPIEATYRFVSDYQVFSAREWAHVWEQYTVNALQHCYAAGVPVHIVYHEDYANDPVRTNAELVQALLPGTTAGDVQVKFDDFATWKEKHSIKHKAWEQEIKPHLLIKEDAVLSDTGSALAAALRSRNLAQVKRVVLDSTTTTAGVVTQQVAPWRSLITRKLHAAYSCKISSSLVNAKVLIRSILQYDASRPLYAWGPRALAFKYELRQMGWIVCTDGELSCVREDDDNTELHELAGDSFAVQHDDDDVDESAYVFELCPEATCSTPQRQLQFEALAKLGGRVSDTVVAVGAR